MKKTFLCLAAAFMAMTSANAQTDTRLFTHLSIGLNVGTPGIGADVAVPATRFLDIQAGFSIMPKITYSTEIHPNLTAYKDAAAVVQQLGLDNVPIQGKLKMINGNVLINFYPIPLTSPLSSLHLTVGAYFGSSSIVEVYNKEQLNAINQANEQIDSYNAFARAKGLEEQQRIGVKLGSYLLEPDANGNAKATLRTNNFKPYVGIGYGRAVPKGRIGFKVDLGVMFWGSPDVVDHNDVSLMKQDWDGKDGGAFRIISKFKVYPVLNFRVCGKIF